MGHRNHISSRLPTHASRPAHYWQYDHAVFNYSRLIVYCFMLDDVGPDNYFNKQRKMIVLPWFVRFGLDCTVAMTPIFYFHHHPTLFIFEYFQNRRRIVRRKSIFHPNQLSITSPTSTTSQQCLAKKPPNCSKSWESNSDMPYHNVIDDQK